MPWRPLVVLPFVALGAGPLLSAEHRAHAIGVFPSLLMLVLFLYPLMPMFVDGRAW